MPTTWSYRRSSFVSAPPTVGNLILSRSGRTVWKVMKASVFRRSGEPMARDIIRMVMDRQPPSEIPPETVPFPWPIVNKVKPTPSLPHASVSFYAAVDKAPLPVVLRSRKQVKRDNTRMLRQRGEDDSPVPSAQRNPVIDKDGQIISPPKVVTSTWRDPDDTNVRSRVPRMSHGYKPYDPIAKQATMNPAVTEQHVVAANCYRLAHQLGPEGGFSSGRDLVFSDRQYGNSQGPTEAQCDNMKNWRWVQAHFLVPERKILQEIVLDRMPIASAARAQKRDPRYLVGKLEGILDKLLFLYKDDVGEFLSQERVVLD